MKLLYLLSLVILCEGTSLLEAPKDLELSSFQNEHKPGFVAKWTGVENGDATDPILGYKVTVWEEDLTFIFELKGDGTLESRKPGESPKVLFDGGVNVLFELKSNGKFVAMDEDDILFTIWQKKPKLVYRLNPVGRLMTLTPTDIPELQLRHDSSTKVYKIDVPATKTEARFNGTKRNYVYEVAVQAYTSKSTGPMSKKEKIIT